MDKSSSDRAGLIKANQYYFTYWHGDKGSLDRPVFKVTSQLGFRFPYAHYGTWGSYAYELDPNARKKIIPLESASNDWINKSFEERNSGVNYPYWYEKYTR